MLAWSCHKSEDYEESKEYGNQFLNIAVEVGNKELEAKACNVLSWSYHMTGDGLLSRAEEGCHRANGEYIQSQSYSRRSLGIAQVVGNRELQAEALCALAWSLHRVRKFTESIKCCKQLLKIAREVQNKELEAEAYFLLGWSYHMTDDVVESVHYSELCLRIAKAVKIPYLEKEAHIVRNLSLNRIPETVWYDRYDKLYLKFLDDYEEDVLEYSMSGMDVSM